MLIRLEGRDTLVDYPQRDLDIESDCEGDSMVVGDGAPEPEEEKEDQIRAVLTTGSFSTYMHFPSYPRLPRNDDSSRWKPLFFYCCTGEILFAPLKSQGVDARSDYIRGKEGTAAPPP